jgi:hypothetical protein
MGLGRVLHQRFPLTLSLRSEECERIAWKVDYLSAVILCSGVIRSGGIALVACDEVLNSVARKTPEFSFL